MYRYFTESLHNGGKMNSLARSNASIYGTKDDLYDRLKRHAYPGKKGMLQLHECLYCSQTIGKFIGGSGD